jgi:phosphoglycerate dehydrogenase-like enzyme
LAGWDVEIIAYDPYLPEGRARELGVRMVDLDTFEVEPLALDSPLRDLDPERMLLTPHNIAHTMASLHANRELAIKSVLTALSGEVPPTVVNPAAVEAWQERFGNGGR